MGSDSVDLDSVEVVASSETGENKDMESAEDVSVMAEGQCGNIFCSRSQVCCRTGNGATHICGAPGSTCCRTRNGAGDRLRSSSEVLQQLQRPRRSNVQQMSSVVCFSRRVLLVQAADRRQVSFGTRVLQSSIDGL